MNLTEQKREEPRKSGVNEMRGRIAEILGADRWVSGSFPAVAPESVDEFSHLLAGYVGPLMIVGSGSSFKKDFSPGPGTLILLTSKLLSDYVLFHDDQVLVLNSGWSVVEVKERLAHENLYVKALDLFTSGTVGGRLALYGSRPDATGSPGWLHSLLGLEVVLPSGEVISMGGRCIKDVAGYDIKHLFTGSGGGCGVIVKAAFRCHPLAERPEIQQEFSLHPIVSTNSEWRKLFDPTLRLRPGV